MPDIGSWQVDEWIDREIQRNIDKDERDIRNQKQTLGFKSQLT